MSYNVGDSWREEELGSFCFWNPRKRGGYFPPNRGEGVKFPPEGRGQDRRGVIDVDVQQYRSDTGSDSDRDRDRDRNTYTYTYTYKYTYTGNDSDSDSDRDTSSRSIPEPQPVWHCEHQ